MKIDTQNLSDAISAKSRNQQAFQSPLDLLVSWEAISDLRDDEYKKIDIGRVFENEASLPVPTENLTGMLAVTKNPNDVSSGNYLYVCSGDFWNIVFDLNE